MHLQHSSVRRQAAWWHCSLPARCVGNNRQGDSIHIFIFELSKHSHIPVFQRYERRQCLPPPLSPTIKEIYPPGASVLPRRSQGSVWCILPDILYTYNQTHVYIPPFLQMTAHSTLLFILLFPHLTIYLEIVCSKSFLLLFLL